MQQEMALMGCVSSQLIELQGEAIQACDSEQSAMRLCVNRAIPFRKQADIAELLDIPRAIFNRMLNAGHHDQPRYMPRVMQVKLQQICGNRAIDQWADLYAKGMLNCQRTVLDRKAELLAELKRLEQETEKLGGVL